MKRSEPQKAEAEIQGRENGRGAANGLSCNFMMERHRHRAIP